MLKKITAILACIILTTSLTACKNDENSSNADNSQNTDITPENKQKIGFMYSGGANENIANQKTDEIRKSLNSDYVETVYIENVSAGQIDKAVKTLVDDGCTVVVSTSNKLAKVLAETVPKHPDVKFLNMNGSKSTGNMTSFKTKIYQASYIAGVSAAYNTKSEKFAVVIESNMYNSIPMINAFALGAQLILENSETRVYYANTEEQSKKAVDAAIKDGCDVILTYQNTEFAYNYAKGKNVWLIGGEVTSESLSETKNLFSFSTDWSKYITDTINEIVNDEWEPELYHGGLNQENIKIGKISDKASENTVGIVQQIENYVRTGQAPIFKGEVKNSTGTIVIFKDIILKPEEIDLIEWAAQGVVGAGNFTEITTDEKPSTFEIKR